MYSTFQMECRHTAYAQSACGAGLNTRSTFRFNARIIPILACMAGPRPSAAIFAGAALILELANKRPPEGGLFVSRPGR
jgi:hypothetical protein